MVANRLRLLLYLLSVNFLLSSIFLSNNAFGISVFFIEDWDTTPAVPNELRGWKNAGNGLAQLGQRGVDDFFSAQLNSLIQSCLLARVAHQIFRVG